MEFVIEEQGHVLPAPAPSAQQLQEHEAAVQQQQEQQEQAEQQQQHQGETPTEIPVAAEEEHEEEDETSASQLRGVQADERWEFTNLHAIDLSRTDDDKIIEELMAQMETIGFLVLTNLEGYDEEKYLEACKALHALSEDEKQALYLQKDEPANANVYRGFQPFKPNDASHKEFFDQGLPLAEIGDAEKSLPLYEETPFPSGEHEWIKEEFLKTQRVWMAVALRVTRLLAQGLGKPADFFDAWFAEKGSLSTLRTIHYQPRSSGLVDSSQLGPEDSKLTTPEHADSGFLTFLATFGYPGLQVYMDGEYRSVAPIRNTLVVNLGDLLARLSDYRLKATFHRVLDIGAERYSSPLFLEPAYSAAIPRGLLESDRTRADEDMDESAPLFGDWLVRRMCASYVEWQGFEIPEDRKPHVDAIQLSDFANTTPKPSATW